MFGGLCFMLHGKMCCGIVGNDLCARVGPERYDAALTKPHVRAMDFTGRPMTGFVYVAPAGLKTKAALARWLDWSAEFAKSASPSKKKRTRRGARPIVRRRRPA